MKGYLIDTNICIFAFRNKHGINERIEQCGSKNCYVSDVTVMELKYGAYTSAKTQENLAVINNFLKKVKVVPFAKAIDAFCQEKVRLQRLGKKLDDYDLLIGCTAKANDLIMVTDNEKHFNRIDGIHVENWVERG